MDHSTCCEKCVNEGRDGKPTGCTDMTCPCHQSAEKKCPICGRTSNLVALDKDCPFCYPNRDDISMVGIDVKPVKDLDWSTDTAEKECTCYAMLIDRDKHPHFWECPQFKWPKWPKWQFDKATPNTEDCATYPDCKGHLVNGEKLKFSHCGQCKADTSDWRERFREQFVAPPPFEETLYSIKPEFIEVFIEKELEEARAEGRGVKENISKMKERAYEEGIARGRADEAIFCHDHKGGGFEAGRTAERARVREIFLWLLGYSDFPERKLGDGTYWWRKELRQKLKAIDLLEDLKVDN